jgi:hypothetical protein
MRCNIPKDVMDMSPSQRQRIAKYYTQQAYNLADKEHERVQEVMIKGNCAMLARVFGFTEEQLLAYISEWKRFYRRLERLGTQEAQDAWLEEQMKECFPTCGFPQFGIDELKRAEDSELLEKGDMKNA